MPRLALSLGAAEIITGGFGAVLIALLSTVAYRSWKAGRITPEEREKRRRAALVQLGKISDATLVEIREGVLLYSYVVRGVEYTASQDVSALKPYMPSELGLGLGPVSVKYKPRNPADSIVLAEDWSGLHATKVG